jgi:hypothetical protein
MEDEVLKAPLFLALVTLFSGRAAPLREPVIASPRLIIFYGGVLGENRRYINDHQDVIAFMASFPRKPDVPRVDSAAPYVEVGLAWNNLVWEGYAQDTTLMRNIRMPARSGWMPPHPRELTLLDACDVPLALRVTTERVNHVCTQRVERWIQPARLYLDRRGQPPLFDYFSGLADAGIRTGKPSLRPLLDKYGVPRGHD